jgi:peptidoglycan/LPS O-acetylase OafA/YrhL
MRSEIKSLTGLRGLAAVWVMLGHYGLDRWGPSDLILRFGAHSYIAVDVFMILSGFVLAMVYEKNFAERIEAKAYLDFLYHRLARIYPVYGLTTALCVVFIWIDFGFTQCDTCGPAIAANVLMVQGWLWPTDSLNSPGWSLSVEWLLNLAFPAFVLLMLRATLWQASLLAAAAVVGLVGLSVLHGHATVGDLVGALDCYSFPASIFRCLGSFLLGMYCWRLRSDVAGVSWFGRTPVLLAIVAGIVAITFSPSLDVLFVLLSCGLVIGCSFERSWVAKCLATPVIHWLGLISYSLYMWHMLLLPVRAMALRLLTESQEIGAVAIPDGLNALICAVVALGISALSLSWFERPAQRWLRNIHRTRWPVALVPVGAK